MNVSAFPPSPVRIPHAAAQAAAEYRKVSGASEAAREPGAAESSLVEILTPEERAFFEQQMALGPLTYREGGTDREPADAPTGRRLDVRG
jgi:hypothetical protein